MSCITQLNATNLYSVNNYAYSDPTDPVESVTAVALCDIGYLAISGGDNIIPDLAENDTVKIRWSISTIYNSTTTWRKRRMDSSSMGSRRIFRINTEY